MSKSEMADITWAAIDARTIAKLLDGLTTDETNLPSHELCLVRAHAWALVDGLQSLLTGLSKASGDRPPGLATVATVATGAADVPQGPHSRDVC
jgi:hypothetical protein